MKFNITTIDGQEAVEGVRVGRSFAISGTYEGGLSIGYALTHLLTGLCVGRFFLATSAIKCAKELELVGSWDFTQDEDCPSSLRDTSHPIVERWCYWDFGQASPRWHDED